MTRHGSIFINILQSLWFLHRSNGGKLCSVLSAVLYCVYTNGLFEYLKCQNIGVLYWNKFCRHNWICWWLIFNVSNFGWITENVADMWALRKDRNLHFSTNSNQEKSKTKCLRTYAHAISTYKMWLAINVYLIMWDTTWLFLENSTTITKCKVFLQKKKGFE